jgi:hypothetical protein
MVWQAVEICCFTVMGSLFKGFFEPQCVLDLALFA